MPKAACAAISCPAPKSTSARCAPRAAEIDAQFRELETLLADSPSQLKNLAQLRTLVDAQARQT